MIDTIPVRAATRVAKFRTPDADLMDALGLATFEELAAFTSEQQLASLVDAGLDPYEVREHQNNLLLYGGVSNLWQCLIGNGVATAGQALTYFNNAQAAIGVGDSSTAAAATQTNLQAASNKLRKAMDATYPLHTDGVISGAATITFRSTFGSADANYAWAEWILANSTTDAVGRSLNRKVEANGTKVVGASWQFTITLSLA